MAGRKAVNSYAEMEEEIANTIKYTGMAREDVEAMNESFRKMDTRTGRDKLNELAQEAGRLGKNTREAVQGYVEAADIINVALVDLGEGATQTIAKLTNIFGVEEILGTKDAMLAVGSTVNVLSQNCTAAKPYLVQFAQRMAGVGAQARMTIPEILAFGATLDANGQKVEMSASAISRLIMMLFQKPRELAATVGLDVQKFTETLNKSTNEGLMMFLGKLQEIGEADALAALSPLFKDLGMDGIRMSQVLATLATHLDMVKWEQEEANKAFKEATSATREYNIFNNTAQAGIDKARKRVQELAISLGEKLLPVYRHIMTSGSAMLRFLNILVSFIIKHKTAIVTVTSALVAYKVAVIAARNIDNLHYALLVTKDALMKAHKVTVLLCSVAYNKLTGNITRADAAQKMLNNTMKANPWGLALAAVAALGVAIYNLASKTDKYTESVKENIKSAKEVSSEYVKEQRELDLLFGKLKGAEKGSDDYKSAKKAIIDQYGKYLSGLIDEKGEIINLTDAYDRLTEAIRRSARERGIAAVKEKMEQEYAQQTADDLNRLQESLEKYGVSAQLAAKTVEQVATALAQNKPIPKDAIQVIEGASRNMPWYDRWTRGRKDQVQYTGPAGIVNNMYRHQGDYSKGMKGIEAMENANAPLRKVDSAWLNRAIEGLEAIVKSGTKGRAIVFVDGSNQGEYKELTPKQAEDLLAQYRSEQNYRGSGSSGGGATTPPGGSFTPGGSSDKPGKGGGSAKAEDKFKVEKEWREREEALNRIAYATGRKNYEEYTNAMLEIEEQFYRRQLLHANLTANEKLSIEAQLAEVIRKQTETANKFTIEQESQAYDERKAMLMQMYLDENITAEQYNRQMELIELGHLKAVKDIYKNQAEAAINEWEKAKRQAEENGEEFNVVKPSVDEKAWQNYIKANATYQDKVIKDQMKKQKEYEEALKRHNDKLNEVWENYFKTDEQKKREYYEATKALIDEAYQRELAGFALTTEEKLKIEEAYQRALAKLRKEVFESGSKGASSPKSMEEGLKSVLKAPFKNMKDKNGNPIFDEDDLANLDLVLDQAFASVSSMYDSLNKLWEAEEQMKLAKLEQRYDREISMAEGNAYKIKELEKKKAREQAQIRAEAQKRQFAQQVLSAIAQTATAAINAYSSAAAIPVVGHVLAPIAAAMATAAGLMQVAVIKQQQTLSNAQGYSKGGFTPDGPADKPVGIVHAGEWVASQKLLKNPATRPAIEALDFAQRNNTFGSISQEDVTRHVTAPVVIAQASSDGSMERAIIAMSAVMEQYQETMQRLGSRLDEPFVTVATVSGDKGIKQAQDEYQRLQNNSLPKGKRK
jgi:TP901 family phage tail tape measure protein